MFEQFIDPTHLALLPCEQHRTVILLLAFTGLRVSSVVTLPRDALVIGSDNHPYLRYVNVKLRREAVIPIGPTLVEQLHRQEVGLRHEDIVSWERRIEIVPREGASGRARSKGGAQGSVPVPGELIRLWSDYMHEEYGELESDFVFVNLWKGEIGRPLS